MNILENLLIILVLLSISVINALRNMKRSIGGCIVRFSRIIISLVVTLILLRFDAFVFLSKIIYQLVTPYISDFTGESILIDSLAFNAINFVIKLVLFSFLYWIINWILKIIIAIVFKATKLKEKPFFSYQNKLAINIPVFACNLLITWFVCALTLTPLISISNLATNAIKESNKVEVKDDYLNEIIKKVDGTAPFVMPNSIAYNVMTYSGANLLAGFVADTLGETKIQYSEDENISVNIYQLLNETLPLGVDGFETYLLYLSSTAKFSDFKFLENTLKNAGNSNNLCNLLEKYLLTLVNLDEGSEFASFLDTIKNSYNNKSYKEGLGNDLIAISNILKDFVFYNAEKTFDESDLLNVVLEYLSNVEESTKVVENLREITSFNQLMYDGCLFGLDKLCDFLSIPKTFREIYDNLINETINELTDKTYGDFSIETSLDFIKYLVDNNITSQQYIERVAEDNNYKNYIRYFSSLSNMSNILHDYLSQDEEKDLFVYHNEKFYHYHADSGLWSSYRGEYNDHIAYSLISSYLIGLSKENALTKDNIQNIIANNLDDVIFADENLSSTVKNTNLAIISKIKNFSDFTTFKVTRDKILNYVGSNNSYTSEDCAMLGKIISNSCLFYKNIVKENKQIVEIVLNNFGSVGTILDSLTNLDLTKNVSKPLFKTICSMKEYKQFLPGETVDKMIENIENGNSTYNELFSTIQSLYKIASQLM